jgi:hypothetical protein
VEEDSGGLPTGLTGRNTQVIAAVEDIWRLDDEWWRSMPLERIYFAVLLASGQRCVIFKDLSAKRWYRQAY